MRTRRSLTVLLMLVTTSGCGVEGDGHDRQPVSGSVTLGDEPLASGMITFAPASTPEPVATAIIQDGSYSLSRADGPAVGPHRVSIWAREPTGRQIPDAFDPEVLVEETVEAVPDRYNLSSELTADVVSGENFFDFDLERSE